MVAPIILTLIANPIMHKYAIQYKFNNSTSDVSAVGEHLLVLGQICTANAYETTISYLSSKF